jgi:hypothetical protein
MCLGAIAVQACSNCVPQTPISVVNVGRCNVDRFVVSRPTPHHAQIIMLVCGGLLYSWCGSVHHFDSVNNQEQPEPAPTPLSARQVISVRFLLRYVIVYVKTIQCHAEVSSNVDAILYKLEPRRESKPATPSIQNLRCT